LVLGGIVVIGAIVWFATYDRDTRGGRYSKLS
jgi:hypothetical protein